MPINRKLFGKPIAVDISDAEEERIQSGIANDPDAAELTDDELAQLRPAREALPPALYAGLIGARKRGRPKANVTKEPVKIRLDRDTLAAFRATGAGWQTRVNEVLREAASKIKTAPRAAPRVPVAAPVAQPSIGTTVTIEADAAAKTAKARRARVTLEPLVGKTSRRSMS